MLKSGLLLLTITFCQVNAMQLKSKIFVAGHRGLVGQAILKKLKAAGFTNIITKTSLELDLRNQAAVKNFFANESPEYVFLSAAKVGGIQANINHPAQFIYDNIMIQSNIIESSYRSGVKKLLFLGSSCIYPRNCTQPMLESYLMNGPLEPTNEYYALAKLSGLKMCQAYNKQYGTKFISCLPCNLYGPNDNFNPDTSHVIPALIHKIYSAKITNLEQVVLWGTGNARREFLYVDDLADAALFLMQNYDDNEPINIGYGTDITIKELIKKIQRITDFKGDIVFDNTKPDGMPRKLLDTTKAQFLGWKATTNLDAGLEKTIQWYVQNVALIQK